MVVTSISIRTPFSALQPQVKDGCVHVESDLGDELVAIVKKSPKGEMSVNDLEKAYKIKHGKKLEHKW